LGSTPGPLGSTPGPLGSTPGRSGNGFEPIEDGFSLFLGSTQTMVAMEQPHLFILFMEKHCISEGRA
jgi:hypothetical protein